MRTLAAAGILCSLAIAQACSTLKETTVRALPFAVDYDFLSESEIKNPELIRIERVKLLERNGRWMCSLRVAVKGAEPISIYGGIDLLDDAGGVVFTDGTFSGNGDPVELNELILQAPPGHSETILGAVEVKRSDIMKISRARIRIHLARIDTSDLD